MIEYKNICLRYGENEIFQDFNLKIDKGEFVTFIGPSGCGKTSLLKMVNGIVTPFDGDVYVKDENIKKSDMISLRRSMGYVIQGNSLFPHLNVLENIKFALKLSKVKTDYNKDIDNWLEKLGLDFKIKYRYPKELSGGQQQRVGILRALLTKPDIILMDEPFGAVDEITKKVLQDEIKKIHEETEATILFVTHSIEEALKLGTKVLVLNNGVVEQYDEPKNILECPKNQFVKEITGQI